MQVVFKVGVTLKTGWNHTNLAALLTLAEAGLTLIAGQLVASRIVINLLCMFTLRSFEDLYQEKKQTNDQEYEGKVVHANKSTDYLIQTIVSINKAIMALLQSILQDGSGELAVREGQEKWVGSCASRCRP
jgi:hypothetical protein